ncbi:hypothetical protein LTS18_015011, partial [Coniosporium uncinatum]
MAAQREKQERHRSTVQRKARLNLTLRTLKKQALKSKNGTRAKSQISSKRTSPPPRKGVRLSKISLPSSEQQADARVSPTATPLDYSVSQVPIFKDAVAALQKLLKEPLDFVPATSATDMTENQHSTSVSSSAKKQKSDLQSPTSVSSSAKRQKTDPTLPTS